MEREELIWAKYCRGISWCAWLHLVVWPSSFGGMWYTTMVEASFLGQYYPSTGPISSGSGIKTPYINNTQIPEPFCIMGFRHAATLSQGFCHQVSQLLFIPYLLLSL